MRFMSTRGAEALSFVEASRLGYPRDGGFFVPEAGTDLRSTVYAPTADFMDFVSLAAAELLPEILDPFSAADLAQAVYGRVPGRHSLGQDILVFDLASGPSASAADYGAAFAAACLKNIPASPTTIVLASGGARDASALAAAFREEVDAPPLLLLCAEGRAAKVPAHLLRGQDKIRIVEVRGGLSAAQGLERAIAAKGSLGGRNIIPLGASTPPRLLGRSLLLVGLFSLARKSLAGDLIVAAFPGDLLGLVTGLWTWSWGLPVSAFLLPRLPGEAVRIDEILRSPPPSGAESGLEFLAAFDRDFPLGSLVLSATLATAEQGEEVLKDGLVLDYGSTLAVRAARHSLEAGLSGHSVVLVPRSSDPAWDISGSRGGLPPSALIDPEVPALEALLSRLFP